MQRLYIANKNYSSWSMRAWLVLTAFDLDFEEILIRFDVEDPTFKQLPLPVNSEKVYFYLIF